MRSGVHWLISLSIGLGFVLGWGMSRGHAQEDGDVKLTPAQIKAIEFYNVPGQANP